MTTRTERICTPLDSRDVVRYVGPGVDEALAALLRHLSNLRTRLKAKRKERAGPTDKAPAAPKDSEGSRT
jgi:hypothetical protein